MNGLSDIYTELIAEESRNPENRRHLNHPTHTESQMQKYLAMAKEQPERYQAMAVAASERMRDYCNFPGVQQRLADFLQLQQPTSPVPESPVATAGAAPC